MDVLQVLYLGDYPGYSKLLGGHAGEDVELVVARYGKDGLEPHDVFLNEEIRVSGIALNDVDVAGKLLGEVSAAYGVGFYNLDVFQVVPGELFRHHLGYFRAAQDHYLSDYYAVFPQEFQEGGHAFTAGDYVKVVSELEGGVELWNNGFSFPLKGDNAEFRLRAVLRDGFGKVCNPHVQEGGVVVQFENRHLELSAGKVHGLVGGAVAQHVHYFVACALFREEHHVKAHVLEQYLVFRGKEILVVNSGDNALCAQLLCKKGADDVGTLGLEGINGYEKVCRGAAGVPQTPDGRSETKYGINVGR